ncbi:hypothetical protein Pla52o_23190 [Novipirellula galeiformis]|uniref:Uncharacterized protein n=1 Tax=Novipirellula galeiformis TaxID=2528004 RepID=A0A5C6CJ73_9BACT|nr:hypothetical protein Pla52o_23190 [Novipirellula galeiformis]
MVKQRIEKEANKRRNRPRSGGSTPSTRVRQAVCYTGATPPRLDASPTSRFRTPPTKPESPPSSDPTAKKPCLKKYTISRRRFPSVAIARTGQTYTFVDKIDTMRCNLTDIELCSAQQVCISGSLMRHRCMEAKDFEDRINAPRSMRKERREKVRQNRCRRRHRIRLVSVLT